MLFEMTLILLGVAVGGFGLAAYWDIRTTEFPDWLPYVMIALALGTRGVFSFLLGDYSYIMNSLIIGAAFLGFGLLLYYLKQWGDGDAWLLGVLGFLFPDSGGFATTTLLPFPAALLFNFFLIAFFYLLAYSVALGLRSRDVSAKFLKVLGDSGRDILKMVGGFTLATLLLMAFAAWQYQIPAWKLLYLLVFPPLLLSVLVFTRYGRFVETNLFKRKIPAASGRATSLWMTSGED
jgi:Flp pilus assembly protein protease CpaA